MGEGHEAPFLGETHVFRRLAQRIGVRRAFAPQHQQRGGEERQVACDVAVEQSAEKVRGDETRAGLVHHRVVMLDDLLGCRGGIGVQFVAEAVTDRAHGGQGVEGAFAEQRSAQQGRERALWGGLLFVEHPAEAGGADRDDPRNAIRRARCGLNRQRRA